jgi:hypothetical protein
MIVGRNVDDLYDDDDGTLPSPRESPIHRHAHRFNNRAFAGDVGEEGDPELALALQSSMDALFGHELNILPPPPLEYGQVSILPRGMSLAEFQRRRNAMAGLGGFASHHDRCHVPGLDDEVKRFGPIGPSSAGGIVIHNIGDVHVHPHYDPFRGPNPLDAVMQRLEQNRQTALARAQEEKDAIEARAIEEEKTAAVIEEAIEVDRREHAQEERVVADRITEAIDVIDNLDLGAEHPI